MDLYWIDTRPTVPGFRDVDLHLDESRHRCALSNSRRRWRDLGQNRPEPFPRSARGASGTNFEHLAEVTVGPSGTLVVELADDANGYVIADAVRVEATPIAQGPNLEVGVVSDPGQWQTWQTVTLPEPYASMVVVATVDYAGSNIPMVARVRNASHDSFEVRVERPDGGSVPHGVGVHYLVVEEGVYTVVEDGIKMEAMRIQSTVTDRKGAWVGQPRSYSNAYTNPVVVGQVMTANDADWSVFWARGGGQGSIPSASTLYVGKHVGEDPDKTRIPEEIGYVVMEANPGTIGTVGSYNYQAAVGSDSIRGPDNNANGYSYSLTGLTSPTTAILSAAAMDGGDGGWPVLYGADSLTASTLGLVFDEDQLSDVERSHTTEQVAYLVFEAAAPLSINSDSPRASDVSPPAVDAVMAEAEIKDSQTAHRIDEALIDLLFSGKLF